MSNIWNHPGLPIELAHIPKEIWVLVNHHKEILERRFPNCKCALLAPSSYWLRLNISNEGLNALIASFSSSSIKIDHPHLDCWIPKTYFEPGLTEVVDYADPRFTDDFIGDILERLGR